jgi:cardiolipin synthase
VAWEYILVAFFVWVLLVLLFTPRIDYQVTTPLRLDSDEFLHVLQAICQAAIHASNRVAILTNGAQFYPAMRDAIVQARASVHLEVYIFHRGEAADMLIDAMVARARAGVTVRMVADSVGSAGLGRARIRRLREAGCRLYFYQPIKWYRIHRLNNRTHRELLIVDGRLAFTGGAGVADWWYRGTGGHPAWRDTMVRIEGPIVGALQGVFAENWLAGTGEILTSPDDWPPLEPAGTTEAMLVKSSPSDRATVSRIVYQMLVEGARSAIDISTPYFLPDPALRGALASAAARGVRVRVIVPGRHTDQRLVRYASRRRYGELLDAGVRIFEYRPGMTHVKALLVDGHWALIGTTNVDNRSFEHNDEVDVVFREAAVVDGLERDFETDLEVSNEIGRVAWQRRSRLERLAAPFCSLLERQQ